MNLGDLKCPSCGRSMKLTRATCRECGITLDGNLEISPLARLSAEDQAFIIGFLRSGGNLTKLGEMFGISYPTVKTRLAGLVSRLGFDIPRRSRSDTVLERLEKGEVTVEEALEALK